MATGIPEVNKGALITVSSTTGGSQWIQKAFIPGVGIGLCVGEVGRPR